MLTRRPEVHHDINLTESGRGLPFHFKILFLKCESHYFRLETAQAQYKSEDLNTEEPRIALYKEGAYH